MGQNTWLVAQLQKRLQTAPEEHVIAKVMMVTHDLLAFGAPEFAHALAPVAESYFDPDSLIAHVPHRTAMYDHTTRFFISYVHSLLQFQLRHRSEQNLLDPETTDGLLKVPEDETVAFWTPHMRDLVLSCLTLTKFVLAANVSSPPTDKYCFVFAEIVKRYIGATRQLYRVSTGAIHNKMQESRLSTAHRTSLDEVKRNQDCIREYMKLTERLNEFYDALRALPSFALTMATMTSSSVEEIASFSASSSMTTFNISTFLNCSIIPEKLTPFPTDRVESGMRTQLERLEELEKSLDTLENVLSNSSAVSSAASRPSHHNNNHNQLTNSEQSRINVHTPPSAARTSTEGEEGGALSLNMSSAILMNEIRNVEAAHEQQQHGRTENDAMMIATSPVISHQLTNDDGSVPTTFQTSSLMFTGAGHSANKEKGKLGDHVCGDNSEPKSSILTHQFLVSDAQMQQLASRFRVLDQVLGKGGFGVVYKAWDEEEGKHVACKEVKLIADNKAALQELYQEYSVLATLKHANVVKVLGFVVHQGHGRIFMEWVPSGSVQSVLQETKKGLREPIVRRYIREALQGLAYLHSRGIVHRDVKPGNMLLNGDGSVKLTDFGTSRTHDGAANTMQTGTVVGTVPYLAPECVRGTYSAASDVWAIGCTALHMITGKAPWASEARDNIGLIFILGNLSQQKQTQLPKLVKEHEMSEGLRSFITSAMTLDRHQRPTADMLLRDAFVTGEM